MKKLSMLAAVAVAAIIMLSACNSGTSGSTSNPENVIDLTSQGEIVSTPTDTQAQYAPEKPFLPKYSREPKSWWDAKTDFYTKEVIDAVYSDDVKAINKAFVNPYAMYYDGEIYTMQWFEEHSAADFESEGIPLQEIESYLEKVKSSFTNSKYEDTEENKEFKALEEKVSEYAKSAN